jgi:hypothetical protein
LENEMTLKIPEWTRRPPTQFGYYWHRMSPTKRARPADFTIVLGPSSGSWAMPGMDNVPTKDLAAMGEWWSMPLLPPKA